MGNVELRIRRLERLCIGLVVALVAVVTIGAVQRPPKEIRAESITLVDPLGNTRVSVAADGKFVGLMVYDKAMNHLLTLGATSANQSMLNLYNESNENPRISITTLKKGGSAIMMEDRNKRDLWLQAMDASPPKITMSEKDVTYYQAP